MDGIPRGLPWYGSPVHLSLPRDSLEVFYSPGGLLCAGWIYAACEDGTPLVKIGHSHSLQRRIRQLHTAFRTTCPLVAAVAVPCCAFPVERLVHTALAAARIERAWFYCRMTQAWLARLVAQSMTVLHEGLFWQHVPPPPWSKSAAFITTYLESL
jgi:T5orf172 domain